MFSAWALSSWALAFAIRSQALTTTSRIGLACLVAAGAGEAMAAVFDINHPLHNLASFFGVLGLPLAAMLLSVTLSRIRPWSHARTVLLWTANLTWVVLVAMGARSS